ncbi:6877_t:CDS:10, partial [Acaulospora morrowiae]
TSLESSELAMTSSDVRDIFELTPVKALSDGNSVPIKKTSKPEREKKPEGIPRELFQLIGGPPPIAFVKPAFKAKPNLRKKAVHWEFRPFINQARKDQLQLSHWIKATSSEDNSGHWFAEYNKEIEILEYNDEEYQKFLTDKEWTKEETDYLFGLCRKYDLRFIVIHDRYEYSERSMEDLKDRYYSVCKKLLQVRPPGSNQTDKGALIALNSYDKVKEERRKKHMCMLYKRNAEQIQAKSLLEEYERIEQNEKKFAKERENLMKLFNFQEVVQPKRKKSLISGPTTPTMEVGNSVFHSPIESPIKKNRRTSSSSAGTSAVEVHSPIEAHATPTTARREKFPQGVVVRSQRIPSPKQAMAAKVQKTLQEFGLGPRPTIPTENVCARWTELQKAIQTLLEIKKGVDKQEHELKAKINLYKKITSGTEGNGSKAPIIGGNGGGASKKPDSEKTNAETSTPKRDRITLTASPRDVKRARK